ncbi:MAG: UDP-N-acetylmuramoyl-L-alanine--D-glutamate ligase [Anaerolineae bacterium]|nr:UDP-N-acetylmuramoyl-L-alanine--D-glutamate ligase [Anaerolineae bacterium]
MADALNGARVVVMGFARQGMALARWLPTLGARVTVTDMRAAEVFGAALVPYQEAGVDFVLGAHPFDLLDGADLLCISGGVPLEAPLVAEARQRGIPVSNDAQLFLERCPAPVIGITGSAGKTTTTSLVGAMCRAGGRTTHVGGNIGDVLLDVLPGIRPDDIVVMELSSFQLELMTTSPHYGAVLNITPNHLDRHHTMAAYTAAKANLIRHQAPDAVAVLGRDDPGAAGLADLAPGRVAWFSLQAPVGDGAYLEDGRLVISGAASPTGEPLPVLEKAAIPLRGDHNTLNTLAACALAGVAGVRPEAMAEAIRAFHGVAHRMEIVRELGGVTWINDSIATAPERVLAAVRSYDEPLVLLLGGKDKDLPWEALVRLAVRKARAVVTFGAHGPAIASLLREALAEGVEGRLSVGCIQQVVTLDDAVTEAARLAEPGDVVLLSPGGTSYDAYQDFEARGAHFRALVAALQA